MYNSGGSRIWRGEVRLFPSPSLPSPPLPLPLTFLPLPFPPLPSPAPPFPSYPFPVPIPSLPPLPLEVGPLGCG